MIATAIAATTVTVGTVPTAVMAFTMMTPIAIVTSLGAPIMTVSTVVFPMVVIVVLVVTLVIVMVLSVAGIIMVFRVMTIPVKQKHN